MSGVMIDVLLLAMFAVITTFIWHRVKVGPLPAEKLTKPSAELAYRRSLIMFTAISSCMNLLVAYGLLFSDYSSCSVYMLPAYILTVVISLALVVVTILATTNTKIFQTRKG